MSSATWPVVSNGTSGGAQCSALFCCWRSATGVDVIKPSRSVRPGEPKSALKDGHGALANPRAMVETDLSEGGACLSLFGH